MMHPLEREDPVAYKFIQFVRLGYLEKEAPIPIPRHQGLPKDAFGKLTGRSILVSLSHGWFFQNHPDPNGVKLDLIRNVFAPRLRERYPHTSIVVFFDFLATPQRPRTEDEEKRFRIAMERMNSVYVYADVILFLEVDLPDLDMTPHSASVDLSMYTFFDFIDTIQVSETTSKVGPQQSDCILTCDSRTIASADELNKLSDTHTLTYLHRPFGRPNTIINDDRGWLFLERITIAIKAAAADKAQFDDIVVSNSEALRNKIFLWTEQLREAARMQKVKPQALRDLLQDFDDELKQKRFSFASDEETVRVLMVKLINQFTDDWKGEVEKQKTMTRRAREILLRWGTFSEDYVERAELLCDNNDGKRKSWIVFSLLVGFVAPMVAVVPFLFALEKDGEDDPSRDALMMSSVWMSCVIGFAMILLLHATNLAFAKIPIGGHTVCACVATSVILVCISVSLRSIIETITPFEALFVGILSLILCDIFFGMIKFIPVKDEQTGQTKRWAIGTWLHMPASHRFDHKARARVKRGLQTTQFAVGFALVYPILGGLFFQSGIFIQALLIPVFFILRAGFEYGADAITSHTFGSDGMPAINFVCLSVMITSIKHPLVFVSLVLSDVLENSFCLWSLARNVKRSSNRVSPVDLEGENEEKKQKPLRRRSSNVVSLVLNEEDLSDKGTALFIASTLLQREAVETLVPMQAAAILSLLYGVGVQSNSIVNGWSDEDWTQSMMYIGVDLGVEMVVFTGTVVVLSRIYPQFDAARILRGLLRMHWVEMIMMSVAAWFCNLIYQSTYAGMDMTMRFDWLRCKGVENSTWLGGFEWEC
eukprot:g489.t1